MERYTLNISHHNNVRFEFISVGTRDPNNRKTKAQEQSLMNRKIGSIWIIMEQDSRSSHPFVRKDTKRNKIQPLSKRTRKRCCMREIVENVCTLCHETFNRSPNNLLTVKMFYFTTLMIKVLSLLGLDFLNTGQEGTIDAQLAEQQCVILNQWRTNEITLDILLILYRTIKLKGIYTVLR